MRRSSVSYALASAAYTLVTGALTWPLILHPRTLVPSDLGDPLLNVWIMWWNASTLPLTDTWWNAPQFFPFKGSFALSEHLLGLAPITTPIILATGEPLLAYNVAFLLSFFLCALATHFCVNTITGRHDVSFVAGMAFMLAPYRMPQIAHIQVLSGYWMPLALAGLHRYFLVPPAPQGLAVERRWPWLVLFAGAWMMQALACGYFLFFLSVLVALWLAWFALFRGVTRDLLKAIAAWAVAAVLMAPVLYGYWRFSRAYNLRRTAREIRQFSADIASLLQGWDWSLAWGWVDIIHRPESDLFPGLTVVLIVIVALVVAWPAAAKQASGYPRAARVLLAVGAVATAVSMARALHGPFRLQIAGLQIISVTSPEKPVSVAALCFLSAALLNPTIRAAWRQRSAFGFYALATFAMWLMSLGPSPTLMNTPAIYKAPYAWLMLLPGADGIRVPARFWMLGAFCLAVTAALGLRIILQRWPRTATWLPAVAVAGILADAWPRPLPLAAAPPTRPSHVEANLRLELPLGDALDTIALYRAMHHRRPLINGYSGYFPPHYWALTHLLAEKNPAVITRLAELGSLEVVVEHDLDPDGGWRRFASRVPDARVVQTTADYTTYFVPRSLQRTPPLRGSRIPFTVSSASVNAALGPLMQDGNLFTRWHAGREQRRGDTITVDLGSSVEVEGVRMLIGGYTADYPRELQIELSDDGQNWITAWSGSPGLLALSGALDDPPYTPLSIALESRPARYVRFTQTGSEMTYYWSIAELQVLGAAAAASPSPPAR